MMLALLIGSIALNSFYILVEIPEYHNRIIEISEDLDLKNIAVDISTGYTHRLWESLQKFENHKHKHKIKSI